MVKITFYKTIFKNIKAETLQIIKIDVFSIVILLIAGWKLTYGLEYFTDLVHGDDSYYLWNGILISNTGFLKPEWAPLYQLWFHILSLFQPDSVKLYFLNYKLLSLLCPVFLYVFLRRYKLPILVSIFISGYMLISFANLLNTPKVTNFAMLIVLPFFIISTYIKKFTHVILTLCIGALVGSYVRPEFFLTFLLLLFLYIGFNIININKINFSKEIYPLSILVFLSIMLIWLIGIPAFTEKTSERTYWAFREHFAGNWNQWTKSNISLVYRESVEIASQNFGNAQSISEAFFNNPSQFLKHIMTNLKGIFPKMIKLLSPIYNDIFRQIFLPANRLYDLVGSSLIFIGLSSYLFIVKRKFTQHIKTTFFKNLKLISYFGLYSIPAIISIVIISPRTHYLLFPIIFLVTIIAILIFTNNEKIKPLSLNQMLIISFSIMVLTPTPKLLFGYLDNDVIHQERIITIKFLNSLELKDKNKVKLIVSEADYCCYISEQFDCTLSYSKRINFNEFMDENKINAVLLSNELENNKRFKDDSDWTFFLSNYMRLGYIKLEILNTGHQLIINESLLRN